MVCILLLAACCFLSFTGCAAHSGPEADIPQAMEQLLLERGYPAALIDGLIPQQLERLYTLVRENDCHYCGAPQAAQPPCETGGSGLYFDVIPSCSTVFINGQTRYTRFYFTIVYEWLELPLNRLEDAITASWDAGLLTYDGGFERNDYFLRNNSEWVTAGTSTRPAKLAQGALGTFTALTSTDVNDEDTGLVGGLKGDVSFELVPTDSHSMGYLPGENVTAVACEYVHGKLLLTDYAIAHADIGYTELDDM